MTGSAPIKVLVIRDHVAPAGGTTYLLETLPQFDPTRVRPSLCVLEPSRPAARAFEAVGIPPVFLERRTRDPRGLLDLLRLVRTSEPDLLFLSGPKSNLLGRLVGRWTGVPAVLRLNNTLPEAAGVVFLQRRLAASTAAGVAVSNAVQQWASRHYGLPPERIRVVHDGRDVGRFAAPAPDAEMRVHGALCSSLGRRIRLYAVAARVKAVPDRAWNTMYGRSANRLPGAVKAGLVGSCILDRSGTCLSTGRDVLSCRITTGVGTFRNGSYVQVVRRDR